MTCPVHGHYRQETGREDCPTCEAVIAWGRRVGALREDEIPLYTDASDDMPHMYEPPTA